MKEILAEAKAKQKEKNHGVELNMRLRESPRAQAGSRTDSHLVLSTPGQDLLSFMFFLRPIFLRKQE